MVEHLVERGMDAAHLEPDVEALLHAEARHHRVEVLVGDVDRDDVGDLRREFEADRVDVGDDDVARADMAGDRRGHDADRPRAGDQHVLADEVEGQRGVDGVAERVEDRADLVVDLVGQAERR